MQNIRSKNTRIEKMMFALLKKHKVKFRKHYNIQGRPDIALPEKRIAVFLDSDFWHGWRFKKWKNKLPRIYWRGKIERNMRRDRSNSAGLRRKGWEVVRLWEHQILKNPEQCIKIIIQKAKNL